MGLTDPAGADVAATFTCRVEVDCVVCPFDVTTYVWPVASVGVPDRLPVVESKDIPAGGDPDSECVTCPSSPVVCSGGVAR